MSIKFYSLETQSTIILVSLPAVQTVHHSPPTTSECLLTPKNAGIPQVLLDVFQAYVFKLHKWVYIDT